MGWEDGGRIKKRTCRGLRLALPVLVLELFCYFWRGGCEVGRRGCLLIIKYIRVQEVGHIVRGEVRLNVWDSWLFAGEGGGCDYYNECPPLGGETGKGAIIYYYLFRVGLMRSVPALGSSAVPLAISVGECCCLCALCLEWRW